VALTQVFPSLWHARVYSKLEKSLVLGQSGIISREYEGDLSAAGDRVHIHAVNDPSVISYVPDTTTLSYPVLTDTRQTLVVDQFKEINYRVDDVHLRQMNANIVEEAASRSAYLLQNEVDTFLSGLYAGGTSFSFGSIAAGDIYDKMVDLSVQMDNADLPKEGRFAVVSPAMAGQLRKNTKFLTAQPNVVLNNAVGRVAGIDILASRNLVANAVPVASTTHGIGGVSSGWAFVSQLQDAEALRLPDRHATGYRMLYIYGGKQLDAARIFDLQMQP
jgi:hypothetical protein